MTLARGGDGARRIGDPIKLPRLPSNTSSFPSREERVQLQAIAEQSRRFLRRLAYSLPSTKPTWDRLDADNNMELYQIRDKSSGDDLINVCGVASIYGTLAEVADALVIPQIVPDPERRGPTTFVDDLLGSQTLLRVDGETSIKWMAVQCVDGMVHRDFVVLHSRERFQDIETRGVVIALHSLDYPGAPPSFETSIHSAYRFVRGGIYRSGFVLLENSSTPGIIDVVSVFKVDFKGGDVRGANKLHRATVSSWLHWMGELNKFLLCEKLRRVGAPRLRRGGAQTPLASTKARRQCESCDAPFKFQFRPLTPKNRRQCMMCSAVLCNACTVEYTESAVTPTSVFCIACIVKWNPDGPTIKFIQPPSTTIGSPATSSTPQIHLRSQVHQRFAAPGISASPTPVAAATRHTDAHSHSHGSFDTSIPILGDEDGDIADFTPPQHPMEPLAGSDTDLHRLELVVQDHSTSQPRKQQPPAATSATADVHLLDGTLPRHTAVFDRSVLRDVDESAADNAGMAHDPVRRLETLRRDMHGAVSDIVRESSRGNAAAVKVALERRKELKEQIKQLQDLLTAQGVSIVRGSNVRRSSEGRVSLHDDLRASQVEVLARRSKTRESVGSFFSKESLDNLNPNDIAALQAKMDSLLVSTPSSSDECRDNNTAE
ncbi:hypothetical protein H310_06888 [Aphanomyces invadans]|uniref:START domain-containing protein n=1 Tax=Aphanomyces invadans TaxID=157072 RepID=A0A024U620_9STRA|nr:hypothetical protein H310_06888 [Aphanomyces invadans]ETW01327.1 hypothetical protein H310_06888 [Aphanomyces invadans]|eukprot:XP_008870325.1 hypothetical protein H310_06888 [Aphanomyces invadans]